jgi:hypothetical protein
MEKEKIKYETSERVAIQQEANNLPIETVSTLDRKKVN